nr:MAG TPA: hypothetical protein [Caudoviricetes sp.]
MFFISYLPIHIDDILDDRKNTAHQKCSKQNADEQKYNKQKNCADYFNHLCFSFLLGNPFFLCFFQGVKHHDVNIHCVVSVHRNQRGNKMPTVHKRDITFHSPHLLPCHIQAIQRNFLCLLVNAIPQTFKHFNGIRDIGHFSVFHVFRPTYTQLFDTFFDIPDHLGAPVIFSLLVIPPGTSPEHLAQIIRGVAVFRLGDLCELIASIHLNGDSQIIAHFSVPPSFGGDGSRCIPIGESPVSSYCARRV